MEIDRLRILVDVAQLGSFAAAARLRDLDPSSVSRMVAQMERELGIRVFQRTTRRLSLTEAGNVFLRRAEAIPDELDLAHEEAVGRTSRVFGTVRITTPVAFGQICVVPLLSRLRQAFPELAVELLMTDTNVDLVRDHIDLAIRLAPAKEREVICAKLRDTRYRVCASRDYISTAPPLERPSDLSDHEALLLTLPEHRSRWLFRDLAGQVTEVPVKGKIFVSNALALRGAAADGLGPALLADWLVERDIEDGLLIDVFPEVEVTATTFETAAWMVYPTRAFLPGKVRVVINFLREHLGG
jgi:DNA-binding transcriptional LysR family regulator